MNKRRIILLAVFLVTGIALTGCNFENVVPDNVPTIKGHAFNLRSNAKRFLYTCYSFLPRKGGGVSDPAFLAGGEIVKPAKWAGTYSSAILRGNQTVSDPVIDYWTGDNGGTDLYQGIRDCNIFLKNIHKVPDMSVQKKSNGPLR